MNNVQKSKILSLGRLSSLSAIKENFRVKTPFHKYESPLPASDAVFHVKQNDFKGFTFVEQNAGGDTDAPPLLFSAISSYQPEKSSSPEGASACPLGTSFDKAATNGHQSLSVSPALLKSEDEQGDSKDVIENSREVLNPNKSDITSNEVGALDSNMVRKNGEDIQDLAEERLKTNGMHEDQDIEDVDEEKYWPTPPKVSGITLDRRDLTTDDKWVRRHPDLVRVKGYHPFKAEPPVTTLMHFGFLTPSLLHFVHNHGPVPHASWDSWAVEVTSDLLTAPKMLSMDNLLLFPPTRLPVTLMSSGNRGKELSRAGNAASTEGLHWGPGAVGTSVWGGARLKDVLQQYDALPSDAQMRKKRYFVILLGADRYGTSIPLEVIVDESRDVLLAYEQNMDFLMPDHGFPVRIIVPGFTEGRSVKWLVKIHVSTADSENIYHLRENRMFPSQVENMQTAISEGWLTRPEFIITDMNVNSVISSPAHNSNILSGGPSNPMTEYSIKGYAYSGGGKKVSKVEVSLDGGKSWKLCKLDHPERPTKYGKYWCWCFWGLVVPLDDLSTSAEIIVRAWDSAMNTQPEFYSWNLLGTMNNCWYRVKIQHDDAIDEDEPPTMTFEHPTQPGSISGGWLQEPTGSGQEMSRTVSLKSRQSETASFIDAPDISPRTPLPWRI